MILRKHYRPLYGILVLALTVTDLQCQQAAKTYAEDEWIPIAPKQPQSAHPVVENVEKKATGRVLNLADPSANNFFPEEIKSTRNTNNLQQYLRETTSYTKPPAQPLNSAPQGSPVRVKAPSIYPYRFETPRQVPSRSPSPQQAYYVPAPPQPQLIQYYRPDEYHTIPEEFLYQPLPQQPFFGQNYELSDLPPIRLNATPTKSKVESAPQKFEVDKENVQLLYVPLESLAPQTKPREIPRPQAFQQAPLPDLPPQFINYRPPLPTKQRQLSNIQNDFAKQAMEAHKLQLQLQQEPQLHDPGVYATSEIQPTAAQTTTTTKKPTSMKRKAHQPPLAVYMGGTSKTDVSDVLSLLKDAKSIDVQDAVGPNSPNIFVGPSSLVAPRGYVKFDLPYLSSLDTNRVDRKVDQYPFFVAPLSYKAPSGYSKIPLPSPHVGSVVVSTKEKESAKTPIPVQNPDSYQEYTIEQRPVSPTAPPIPNNKVINQYGIDELNAFVPQFQETPQRDPESVRSHEIIRNHNAFQVNPEISHRLPGTYNVENFQPSTAVTRPKIHFLSTPQPPLPEQLFIDEILQQQQKPTRTEYVAPEFQPQTGGQYFAEVTKPEPVQEQLEAQEYPLPVRTPTRRKTTPSPQSEQYDEEVTKPSRVRSKPTSAQMHVRESYESSTRATHLRTRPSPATTPSTTTESLEHRPTPRLTTETPRYPIQDQIFNSRSTTSSTVQQYSPVAHEYDEEVQSHRPVIYKYKHSEEDIQDYQRPVYQSTTASIPVNQHTLNQDILDSKVLSNQPSAAGNYVSGPGQIQQFQEEFEAPAQEQVKTQNANVENYNIGIQLPQSQGHHVQLPNLINNLEDQSVRQLLQPGLIPTSPQPSEVERYEIRTQAPLSTSQALLSNYPSTHLPIVDPTTTTTTTTRKAVPRGRGRGSRFTTTTQNPMSTTRRTQVSRGRRPLPSRSRYSDDDSTTDETIVRSTTDPTKRIVTSRSRFRTRGRPAEETTDRSGSTHDQDVTQSITQHQPSVQIIDTAATPRIHPEYISYRPVYNVPADGIDAILISNKKVSKPATEPVVIHQINQLPIKNLEEENTENTSTKLRSRGRRPSTTMAPHPTSRKFEVDADEKDEEFYGFFRKPAFNKPTESTPTSETSRPIYSSTYVSSTAKPQIQQIDIQPQVRQHSDTDNIQFVGEIRPKYQVLAQHPVLNHTSISTERMYPSTIQEVEEEMPRMRTRARIPSRRVVSVEAKEEDEVKTSVRARTRGKTQYRMPQKSKRPLDSSEDEDVEGGNYPVQFKARHATARPSFQITVDPHDQDQESFASIYRPSYIAKENNNKDSSHGKAVEFYQLPNYLLTPDKDIPIALPSIASAPEVNLAIQEEQQKAQQNEKGIAQFMDDMMQDYEEVNGKHKAYHTEMPKQMYEDNDDIETPVQHGSEIYTTLAPETTTQKRRRGVWKLVRRPVDVLESAETQNSVGNQNQVHEHLTKPIREENVNSETTIANEEEEEDEKEITTIPSTAADTTAERPSENGFIDSLYNMFGISNIKSIPEAEESQNMQTTTGGGEPIEETTYAPDLLKEEAEIEEEIGLEAATPTSQPSSPLPAVITTTEHQAEIESVTPLTSMTYITPMSLETWNMKTSTSTEISHETEICYKGKCVKSKDMKVPMT